MAGSSGIGVLSMHRTGLVVVALLGALCAACGSGHRTQDNVILNGDLTKGSGSLPDHWKNGAYDNWDQPTIFRWNHTAGAPGELEISNLKPNDAAWGQTVHLTPGWYHMTVSARAEGVPESHAGVSLSCESFTSGDSTALPVGKHSHST